MKEVLKSHIAGKIQLTDAELQTILSYFKPMRLEKNQILLNNGESSKHTYFVAKGCLRIYFMDENGAEATRFFAFENQFATALVSFITKEPSDELIQALEPTEILAISHEHFYQLLDLIPAWEKFYRIYLETAYVTNTKRLMSFLTQDALEKYRQLLAENPLVVQRLSNKMVASYLNISQETLSRLKSKR